MLEKSFIKQKQAGVILILLGVFVLFAGAIFIYFRGRQVTGLPGLIPAKNVAAYIEFSTLFDDEFTRKVSEMTKIDWKNEIVPWSDHGAFVFLNSEKNKDQLVPFGLFWVTAQDKATVFLKTLKNPKNKIAESQIGDTKVFSTPALAFAFLNDVAIISSSAENLGILLSKTSPLTQHLGNDGDFVKISKNLYGVQEELRPNQFFVYTKPQKLPFGAYEVITRYVPSTPLLTSSLPAVGVLVEKNEKIWDGKSFAITDSGFWGTTDQAYRALLLSYVPPHSELLISGQNLATQLKKIDSLTKSAPTLPGTKMFTGLFTKEYLPEVDFAKDIEPLFAKEFAITATGKNILAVTELPPTFLEANIEKLHAAFKKIGGKFVPKTREVTLADGTKAYELVPDPDAIKSFSENFRGIEIKGFVLGEKKFGIYDAVTQGKWFISNDLNTIKKALLLTKEPGLNFRDSSGYVEYLRPVLNNPEFLGVAALPEGVFSFSKRTFGSHMETNFRFVVK